jgi:hypothetical protein
VRTAPMFSPAIWPWLALAMKRSRDSGRSAAYHSRVIRTMELASKIDQLEPENERVTGTKGAVSAGRSYLFPPLSSGGAYGAVSG